MMNNQIDYCMIAHFIYSNPYLVLGLALKMRSTTRAYFFIFHGKSLSGRKLFNKSH